MVREEDSPYGLTPGLSMTPAGYIPPAAATLASGLAGITAQQAALRKQMAQEQDQRNRDFMAQRQALGQSRLALAQQLYDPAAAAKAAEMVFGSEAPSEDVFGKRFAQQQRAARGSEVSSLLGSKNLSNKTRQALMSYWLMGEGTPPASAPSASPAAGGLGAPPAGPQPANLPEPEGETNAQLDVAPPQSPLAAVPAPTAGQVPGALPSSSPLSPAVSSASAPAAQPLMFNGIPLTFDEDTPDYTKVFANQISLADYQLGALDKGLRERTLAPGDKYDAARSGVATLRTELGAAQAANDFQRAQTIMGQIDAVMRELKWLVPQQAAPATGTKAETLGGFDYEVTTRVLPNGDYVVTRKRKGEVPLTSAQRREEARAEAGIRIRQGELALGIQRFNLAVDTAAQEALGKAFPNLSVTDRQIDEDLKKRILNTNPEIAALAKGDSEQQGEAMRQVAEKLKDPTLRANMRAEIAADRVRALKPAQQAQLAGWLTQRGYGGLVNEGLAQQRTAVAGTAGAGGAGTPAPGGAGTPAPGEDRRRPRVGVGRSFD